MEAKAKTVIEITAPTYNEFKKKLQQMCSDEEFAANSIMWKRGVRELEEYSMQIGVRLPKEGKSLDKKKLCKCITTHLTNMNLDVHIEEELLKWKDTIGGYTRPEILDQLSYEKRNKLTMILVDMSLTALEQSITWNRTAAITNQKKRKAKLVELLSTLAATRVTVLEGKIGDMAAPEQAGWFW